MIDPAVLLKAYLSICRATFRRAYVELSQALFLVPYHVFSRSSTFYEIRHDSKIAFDTCLLTFRSTGGMAIWQDNEVIREITIGPAECAHWNALILSPADTLRGLQILEIVAAR